MFSLTDAFTLGISRIRMAGHQWSSTAVLGPLGPAGIDARPGQETGDWRLETGDSSTQSSPVRTSCCLRYTNMAIATECQLSVAVIDIQARQD